MNALSTQLKLAFCYIRSCNVCQSNSTKYEGKHSSRTDSVSMHIIKAVDLGILIRLTLLVNLTMVMSVYLAGEIVRRVIPLFQEGSITCKGNYKSIETWCFLRNSVCSIFYMEIDMVETLCVVGN